MLHYTLGLSGFFRRIKVCDRVRMAVIHQRSTSSMASLVYHNKRGRGRRI